MKTTVRATDTFVPDNFALDRVGYGTMTEWLGGLRFFSACNDK